MNRQVLIEDTISKISKLPDVKIKEVNDFVEFLLSKIDDRIISEGIKELISASKAFEFLKDEEDLYSVNDLKKNIKKINEQRRYCPNPFSFYRSFGQ